MANLPETETYDAGVYQIEVTDAVVGGVGGKSNAAAINLSNRTKYLKAHVDTMETIVPQGEAEARTATTLRGWTAQRVGQAIAAGITALVGQATETFKGILEIATQAETKAGSSDAVAVTPLKLCYGFSFLFETNGYFAFPSWMGGFIINWGRSWINSGADNDCTFANAFPTAFLTAFITMHNYNADMSVGTTYSGQVRNMSTTQITIRNLGQQTQYFNYIALGY